MAALHSEKTCTDLGPERPTWSVTASPHPAPSFWRFRKGFCLKIKIIRKAEPGSVFFTQPAWGFRRAWNAINTDVKSTFVHYEVMQCYCYLTYKQLLSTNVNCHWDLELLYTSEINLSFRLACYRILPSPALDPSPQSGHAIATVTRLTFLYAISLFMFFLPEVLLY